MTGSAPRIGSENAGMVEKARDDYERIDMKAKDKFDLCIGHVGVSK